MRRGSSCLWIGWALLAGAAAFPLEALQDKAADPSVADVVEKVVPAVVSVYSRREPERGEGDPFFGPLQRRWTEGMGSGVIVRPDGLILTNNHVVEQAVDLRVVLSDRREFKARVVGRDPQTDIALIRIDARDLPHLAFGDSSKVRVGDTVLAVGNPLGIGQTVSKGIVSAKGRANVGIADYEDFLQTDAAINPGNSGGALVDLRGTLIGVNTAIASRTGGFQGIGFAIPSDMAREVMALLLRDGRVNRGQLGVQVQDLTPALAEALGGVPDGGVLIAEVVEGSPAAKAGLRRGDVVRKVDGEAVGSSGRLRNRVALRGAGALVKLEVWRDGKAQEVDVRLRAPEDRGAAPGRESQEAEPEEDARSDSGLPGLSVTPATPRLLARLGLPPSAKGLVVTAVDPARLSPRIGLREGDLIVEVNRAAVATPEDMREALKDRRGPALLTVRRGALTLLIAIPR
jgi:serine protease Do